MTKERVVIVGGGLAGLASAVELVDRGMDVTLIEAGSHCGGKLSAWRDKEGDPVEHGMHGWWPNYVNFFDLMHRVGVSEQALQVAPDGMLIRLDGSIFIMKPLLIRLPSPLFLVYHFIESPVRGIVDLLSLVRAGMEILSFNASCDFKDLDRYTFRSWLWQQGVSQRMYQYFFEPYVRSFAFDSATRVSLAATLSSYQLYVVRHQDDVLARWLTDDPDSLIIQPIVDYIRQHGGRVITGIQAEDLIIDPSGQITAVQISQPIDGSVTHELPATNASAGVDHTTSELVSGNKDEKKAEVEVARLKLSRLPEKGFLLLPGDNPVMVAHGEGNNIIALSGRCTHMGCTITWSDEAGVFSCPCHGAMFARDGKVLAGPAQRPLTTYITRIDGDDLLVLSENSIVTVIEGDYFIVAVDVEAFKRLLPDRLRELETFRMIDFLGTTPVIVVRLWFPGANLLGDKTSGVFIDYPLLDNFFVLSNLQKSFRSRDETVLEVQAYLVEDEIELPDNSLMELVLADLRRAFTTLSMPPRKFYIQRHKSVFTSHVAGSDESRPDTCTPVPNLYLAGDWVTRCPEVWNMERAIVTGKQAAAAVIEDAGGVGPAILSAPLGSPLFRVFVATVRTMNGLCRWLGRLVRGDSPPALPMVRVLPKWNSAIRIVAINSRGQPNEQFLIGKIRNLIGKLKFVKSSLNFRATGDFLIDLESFDSGNRLRDYYVRATVLNTQINHYAKFHLIEIHPLDGVMSELVFDKEFSVECAGELTLNGVTQPLSFRLKVVISRSGMVSALAEDDIIIHASDFNLNLDSLHVHDGAVVDDEIRLSFRLAIPYEVTNQ